MTVKICEECTGSFKSSRKSQRFCSIRCGNRKRDRMRRTARRPAVPVAADSGAIVITDELKALQRKLETSTKICQRRVEILQSKLRSQSYEIDRLEAENSEQRQSNNVLQLEVARLKRAQRTNVQDLAHLAAWLVSLANAKDVALDPATLDILNRRGWHPSKRQARAARP
ncbi:hypothetical protein V1639_14660 [Pseudarthrobacter sp. J75]|uniref:hypothetical protein n=1 Tax=unclassified Pseudarthrobacter TaxID=2647000 RepID=UPI002E823F8C|nr:MULTISPECIES: hypothetical protein [unclassified Pseudarthrobacter]MEE2523832.1 hypothetical protein [Pseudarthrobacter sp. J47]MEE2530262.1 hypothetical protein [Pseudarthrobacter sp. J75]